jgi:hypothetical protein
MHFIGRLLIVGALILTGFGVAPAQNHHFRDNGDGTVSDLDTGLMWEKKVGSVSDDSFFCPRDPECGNVHNVNDRYRWSLRQDGHGDAPDGPAFTDFLATLNRDLSKNGDEITGCFAKHCDWRLPNIDELKTIVDRRTQYPSIDAIFGPTRSDAYWSATTQTDDKRFAWAVVFRDGDALSFNKAGHLFVRAVRGGSDRSNR